MGRTRREGGKDIPLTDKEEALHSAEEKIWEDSATDRSWAIIRNKRDQLLKDSDFTQLDDSPKDKVAWKNYRQELRGTTDVATPDDVVWPSEPI